jgi:hypothetical protein
MANSHPVVPDKNIIIFVILQDMESVYMEAGASPLLRGGRRYQVRERRSSVECDVVHFRARSSSVGNASACCNVSQARLGTPGKFFPLSGEEMRRWRGTSANGDG